MLEGGAFSLGGPSFPYSLIPHSLPPHPPIGFAIARSSWHVSPVNVTVARVNEFQEALLLRSVLEADGMEVFLPDEFVMQNTPHLLFANDGVRVQVKPEDEARARAILDSKAEDPAP